MARRKPTVNNYRATEPLPLDPWNPVGDEEDSELGVPEGWIDPHQYRAFPPPPRPTVGFGYGI